MMMIKTKTNMTASTVVSVIALMLVFVTSSSSSSSVFASALPVTTENAATPSRIARATTAATCVDDKSLTFKRVQKNGVTKTEPLCEWASLSSLSSRISSLSNDSSNNKKALKKELREKLKKRCHRNKLVGNSDLVKDHCQCVCAKFLPEFPDIDKAILSTVVTIPKPSSCPDSKHPTIDLNGKSCPANIDEERTVCNYNYIDTSCDKEKLECQPIDTCICNGGGVWECSMLSVESCGELELEPILLHTRVPLPTRTRNLRSSSSSSKSNDGAGNDHETTTITTITTRDLAQSAENLCATSGITI